MWGAKPWAALRSLISEILGYDPSDHPVDRAACPPGGMKGGDAECPPAAFPPASVVGRAPLGEVASGPLWSVMQVGRKTLLMGPGVTLTLDAASADMIARQLMIAGTMQGRRV